MRRTKRSRRRHRTETKHERRMAWQHIMWDGSYEDFIKYEQYRMMLMRDTGTLCSCARCGGNPRKWWKDITFKEKKAKRDMKEQMKDLRDDRTNQADATG